MRQHQIRRDVNKLNKLLEKVEDGSSKSLHKKVKKLYHKIFQYFCAGKLKKLAIGSAAALLLHTNANTQSFGPVSNANPYGLSSANVYPVQPAFADLDNDGDQDLIFGQDQSTNLRYAANTTPVSGSPISFGASQINPFNYTSGATIAGTSDLADLDNDGDFDLAFGTYAGGYSGNITYLQNNGSNTAPNFNTATNNPFNLTLPANTLSYDFNFGDFDGDGDYDILMQAGVYYVTTNLYFQNTGSISAPNFAAHQTNPFGLTVGGSSLSFVDIDNDNDLDAFYIDNGFLKYQENTGSSASPAFGTPQNNPFNLKGNILGNAVLTIAFTDIDNDGNIDYLARTSSNVYVQLNTTITSTKKIQKQDLNINIYPTPSHDLVNVQLERPDDYTLEVFNLQGQQLQVYNIQQATQHQLDLSELANGQYLLKISTKDYYTTKKLLKQ